MLTGKGGGGQPATIKRGQKLAASAGRGAMPTVTQRSMGALHAPAFITPDRRVTGGLNLTAYTHCVPARLPTLAKSGFLLDPRPLDESASPHAGALAISRAFRSLKIPELAAANLQLKARRRGYEEAQFRETIMLLQAVGGECPEDLCLLNQDPMLG